MSDATTTTLPAPPSRCLLCGEPTVFGGLFTPDGDATHATLYGLCGQHPLDDAATFAEVERVISRIEAERN
jgi:hypothetical protein